MLQKSFRHIQGGPTVSIYVYHECNRLIHSLFWDSSHTPCSLQEPKNRYPLMLGQASVAEFNTSSSPET